MDPVYNGIWIDYDKGPILGATLTLPKTHASILLASTAVIVTLAAGRSWKFWCFLWHCIVTKKIGRNRKFNQVILRNSQTPAALIWNIFGAPSDRSLRWALIAFAVLHIVLFTAAGILTSQIFIGQLVCSKKTPSCGQWSPKSNENLSRPDYDQDQTRWTNEHNLNKTLDADNYARNCYQDKSGIINCDTFVSKSLSFHTMDADCPFKDCLATAYAMDTGNITFSQLGINSKESKHMSFQKRTTCTPQSDNKFHQKYYDANDFPDLLRDDQIMREYSFFFKSNGEPQIILASNRSVSGDYDLTAYHLPHGVNLSEPLSGTSDHDVSIILLSSLGITFLEPQDDPFFSAHSRIKYTNTNNTPHSDVEFPVRYGSDNLLNVIACDERIRYCNLATGKCTEWSGLFGGVNVTALSNTASYIRAQVLVSLLLSETNLPGSLQERSGSAALQAARFLVKGEQMYLEPEQWKVELKSWFAISLARLQLQVYSTIAKSDEIDTKKLYNTWNDTLLTLCGQVKFNSSLHTSLSVFGLFFVLAIASLLFILSFVDVFLELICKDWTRAWMDSDLLAIMQVQEACEPKKNCVCD